MASDNFAAVLRSAKHIETVKVQNVMPGPEEVQITMKTMTICGSDVAMWKIGHLFGDSTKDLVLGHGGAGVVSKIGSNVDHIKEGDKVTMNPVISCSRCRLCQSDSAFLCEDRTVLGVPAHPFGCLMQRLIHPAQLVHKVPESMSMDEASMVEQLCIAYRACEKAGISKGTNVLITGAGSVGLCCLLMCKALGSGTIVITDLEEKRLEMARSLGATHTFLVCKDEDPAETSDKLVKATGGQPDCALEASGAEVAITLAVHTVKKMGVIVNIGIPHENPNLQLNMMNIIIKEIQLKGSAGYIDSSYKKVIEMVANGLINVKPVITHHFPLNKAQEAFEAAHRREGVVIAIDVQQR